MATDKQIKQRVLAYFRKKWPNANEDSNFSDDFGLDPRQLLDYGTELAIELNCNPTRTQIGKCKTIKDLIDLLIKTSGAAAGTGS